MCLVSQAACCSHHHLSTSCSTYSLLHLCPHIISSNIPSPLRLLPASAKTQALTIAQPSSVCQKSGWNSLPTEVIKLIVSRVDNLSTMPLAACSLGLYCLLKALRMELFKPAPCLLMPPDLQKRHVTQHNNRRVASIKPLDCDPIPVSLNYINGMYWVGMNTSWMVLVDGRSSWMLAEVYNRRLIPFLRLTLHYFGTAAQNTRNLTVANMIPSLICSTL